MTLSQILRDFLFKEDIYLMKDTREYNRFNLRTGFASFHVRFKS